MPESTWQRLLLDNFDTKMTTLDELKKRYKIYDYRYGGYIPDIVVSQYESYFGYYTDEHTFIEYFNRLLEEILENPTKALLLPKDKVNFRNPSTYERFKVDLIESYENGLPYLINDQLDKFLDNCFHYPKLYDRKIRKLSKWAADTFFSLLLKYCFKEYNDEIILTSDIHTLKNWKSLAERSKFQIQFLKDEIHLTPTKRHVREYQDYCKALRGVVKMRLAEVNASISNSETNKNKNSNSKAKQLTKTFKELFDDKSDLDFAEKLLKELKITNESGVYNLGNKKRSSILGYAHGLRDQGLIPDHSDEIIMTALMAHIKTSYSRLKPESNTYRNYFNRTITAIRKRQK